MIKQTILSVFTLSLLVIAPSFVQSQESAADSQAGDVKDNFISNSRRLTFEGRRSGEGYFSADGKQMVFQSEREPGNPFYQIYVLDFETGDLERVSPGKGKTTCAWIHPDGDRVLFASTHDDPEAVAKQKAEIAFRESGESRRYSWDYDPEYEIYDYNRETEKFTRLTEAKGYDAEGSYSPDGKLIAFASNRLAYSEEMNAEQKKAFDQDPAYMMDIYIMDADGKNVKQLTNVPGYDGGPFFSADGKKICWRRFSENGALAEIMTMNIDGTDQKQLTNMRAMSWAPYFHPSGKYLVYTTNIHGFANFELYLVASDGKSKPVRVSNTEGFDGLASFSPDGNKITWTSKRIQGEESQIYLANWDHEAALKALGLDGSVDPEVQQAFDTGDEAAKKTTADFDARDIIRHVDFLCRRELGGRMTGSIGERKATAYVAAYLENLGLVPAGEAGSWFQEFEFPNGARVGKKNDLSLTSSDAKATRYVINKDWRPLTFSGNGTIESAPVVFAGYGIVAPKSEKHPAYDSYGDLDVKDKWVMVFRFVPEDVSAEMRQHLQFHGNLRKKSFFARERGAKGLIVVSGPNSQVKSQLVPLQNDFSPSGSSILALSITDDLAEKIVPKLMEYQTLLDGGEKLETLQLDGHLVGSTIDVEKVVGVGRNVIGRLMAGEEPSKSAIIVGAHVDHLGAGKSGSSLAREEEKGALHLGADDNASGVAAMLEVAEYMAILKRQGKLKLKHDIIFAAWSGEELGLHGSQHYVDSRKPESSASSEDSNSIHDFVLSLDGDGNLLLNGELQKPGELESTLDFIAKQAPDFVIEIAGKYEAPNAISELLEKKKIKNIKYRDQAPTRELLAAFNMDMVGRLKDKLVLQGIGSSPYWKREIESKNAVVGLPLSLSNETDLPTDASSFYRAGVPILSAFTGSHTDYHTPRDTPEKLNYPDAARIARLMGLIVRSMATKERIPAYTKQEAKPKQELRGGLRAYLGTVPSYGEDVVGVKLSDASKGGPADKAGVQAGDIIVELAGRKIENIYDYTAVIDGIKIGEEIKMVVDRAGKRIELKITPGSRQ